MPVSEKVTQLLLQWGQGDERALEGLLPLLYDELRERARHYLRRERPDHTLQPTALVHEAFLRLVDQERTEWQNRAHFLAVAAQLMRRILIDHARSRRAAKRGGGLRVTLSKATPRTPAREVDYIALDLALERLAEQDELQAKVVELRYFGGLTIQEAAEVLDISPSTLKREWNLAKAWIYRDLIGKS